MAKTKTEVALTSSEMVNTPGILAWACNGYHFQRDRGRMVRVISKTYNLTKKVATGLLDGTIKYKVEGDKVVFSVEGRYKAKQ